MNFLLFLRNNLARIAAAVPAALLVLGVKCQLAWAQAGSDVRIWGFEGQQADTAATSIVDKLKGFASSVTGFVAIAAVIALIAGGFMFITSGGNERRVETAKNIILYSIVGIAVALFAQMIVTFAVYKLKGQ